MRPDADKTQPEPHGLRPAGPSPFITQLPRRERVLWRDHPKEILERVYTAGSLPVSADDGVGKDAVLLLASLGLLVVEEILVDGTARRIAADLLPDAKIRQRPWRVSKPAFSNGTIGMPDANGALVTAKAWLAERPD